MFALQYIYSSLLFCVMKIKFTVRNLLGLCLLPSHPTYILSSAVPHWTEMQGCILVNFIMIPTLIILLHHETEPLCKKTTVNFLTIKPKFLQSKPYLTLHTLHFSTNT